jgi:predicted MFS family arabinose efflux permease
MMLRTMSSPPVADASTPRTYSQILAVPEFRAIFAAQLIATLGNVVSQITLSVLVYQRTGSPLLSSLTFALGFAPYLLGAGLVSAVADRYPSRRVLVTCEVLSCVLVAVMAVPGTPIIVLLALLVVLGTLAPVFQGTRAASLPEILTGSEYALGRSLLRMVSQSTQIVGFGLGGVLLLVVSPTLALLIASAGFATSALLLRFGTRLRPARLADGDHDKDKSIARASLSSVRQVFAVPGLRPLLLMTWLPPMFAVAPEALAAPYASQFGDHSSAAVGLLLCAAPLGSVVGEALAGTFLPPAVRVRFVTPVAMIMFVPMFAFVFQPGPAAAVAALFVCGFGFTYAMGLDQRVLDVTPERLRGRALTVTMAGLMVGQGIGFAAAGAAAEFLPAHVVIVAAGVLGLVAVLLCGSAAARTRRTA